MNGHRVVGSVVAASLVLWSFQPRPAAALDLASATVATGGGVVAIIGAVMMGKEESADTGRTMLTAGLAVSGVFSGLSVVLNLVALRTYDRLSQIEREADLGGGPLIDALSTSFGVSRDEVIASVRKTQARHSLHSAEDAQLFAELLVAELGTRARISETLATTILYDLQTERARVGTGAPTPRHQVIADVIGVEVADVAPLIARHLDEALAAGAEEEKILSARTLLASEATLTLNGLVDALAKEHEQALQAQVEAGRSSRAYDLMAIGR